MGCDWSMIAEPITLTHACTHLLVCCGTATTVRPTRPSCSSTSSGTKIKALCVDSVRIKDRDYVETVLHKLVEGGPSKLQVITDFDRTLTRPYYNGKECLSSYGIFNLCSKLPKEFVKQSEALYQHYRPLEADPHLSIPEKSIFMEEWTRKKADLLHFDLDVREIYSAVVEANVALRDGTDAMLQSLSDSHVPVLVFSAGLGDTVHGVLRHRNVLHPNMHIISNFLRFHGGKVSGMRGDIIHTFNKNESAVRNTEYFDELTGRGNVIVLGDALGDASMADGVRDVNAVLKIGFLQDRVAENLGAFMDHFDIVLIDDHTMNLTNELLQQIL